MAEGEGAVWIGRKAENDLSLFCVFQLGKSLPSGFGFTLFEKMGSFGFKHRTYGVEAVLPSHGIGGVDLLCHQSRDGFSVLPQIAPHGHDASDDGPDSRLPFVLQRILKRHMTNQGFCICIGLPVHVAHDMLAVALQEMLDSWGLEQPLLGRALSASDRYITLTMFFPKPFHCGPSPSHVVVNAVLLNQRVQGLLRGRVGGVTRAHVGSYSG